MPSRLWANGAATIVGLAALCVLCQPVAGAQESPAPAAPQTQRAIPRTDGSAPDPPAERPWLVAVPELDLRVGYSDNIFVTPDVLGLEAVSDSFLAAAPRLRLLAPLTSAVGLVGDATLDFRRYADNGDARAFNGRVFLGYRPVDHRHAEIGIRGGVARVSEFERNDTDEFAGFLQGTYGFTPRSLVYGGVSGGVREFPERTRREREALVLGILPPPSSSVPPPLVEEESRQVREGQDDDLVDIQAGFMQRFRRGSLRIGYQFRSVDSDVDVFDADNHWIRLEGSRTWTDWLATEFDYSARFRDFRNATARTDAPVKREDTIQELSLELRVVPAWLRDLPLTRSAFVSIRYGFLRLDSNVSSAELERNQVSVALEFAFDALTGAAIED